MLQPCPSGICVVARAWSLQRKLESRLSFQIILASPVTKRLSFFPSSARQLRHGRQRLHAERTEAAARQPRTRTITVFVPQKPARIG